MIFLIIKRKIWRMKICWYVRNSRKGLLLMTLYCSFLFCSTLRIQIPRWYYQNNIIVVSNNSQAKGSNQIRMSPVNFNLNYMKTMPKSGWHVREHSLPTRTDLSLQKLLSRPFCGNRKSGSARCSREMSEAHRKLSTIYQCFGVLLHRLPHTGDRRKRKLMSPLELIPRQPIVYRKGMNFHFLRWSLSCSSVLLRKGKA